MGRATGRADLPLHGGRVPQWLADRMAALGRIAVEALVLSYGRDEVLRRLAHPFWFQSLGCVMGMDWHSSGITTSVLGALKRGLQPLRDELGLEVCGGRGRHSRSTPSELVVAGARWGLDGDDLAKTSKLVAKVDSAAVQDGFQIYLHGFIVAADGQWVVVQQGMATDRGLARRYHWASAGLDSFVDAPHAAIEGQPGGAIVNLTDRRAAAARRAAVEVVNEGPDRGVQLFREATRAVADDDQPRVGPVQDVLPHLFMPHHHDIRPENVVERRLHGVLAAAADEAELGGTGDSAFEGLLAIPGVGARALSSLALIGEVLHGAPSRFTDPARFALALGGKDGHPFPVPLDVYDAALGVYRQAIEQAKLGRADRLEALRRLSLEAQRLETWAAGGRWPTVSEYIEQERRDSWRYGGMTVDGPALPPAGSADAEPVRQPASSTTRSRKPRSAPARRSGSRAPPGRRTPRCRQLSLPGV